MTTTDRLTQVTEQGTEEKGVGALLLQLEEVLRAQTAAAQADDAGRVAGLGEDSVGLLAKLAAQPRAAIGAAAAAALGRLRDLAAYNQLLLRYTFTGWAAARMDRQRTAQRYNARGRLAEVTALRTQVATPRGVL